jgi:hypothetical protein
MVSYSIIEGTVIVNSSSMGLLAGLHFSMSSLPCLTYNRVVFMCLNRGMARKGEAMSIFCLVFGLVEVSMFKGKKLFKEVWSCTKKKFKDVYAINWFVAKSAPIFRLG